MTIRRLLSRFCATVLRIQRKEIFLQLFDGTKNQHFLSQTEQRLNAIDPSVNKQRQQIYEFEVLSRVGGALQLGMPKRKKIATNLSLLDLFSFDVDRSQNLRQNFEALFHKYENEIAHHTESLLSKVAIGDYTVGRELENIFAAKMLGFARNPYSIEKILDTFGEFADFIPVEPDKLFLFNKVLAGSRAHQDYLCKTLNISAEQYGCWLRLLFMMLAELKPGFQPLFDQLVKRFFTSNQFAIAVMVCTYSQPSCLLSDRAVTTGVDNPQFDGFDFNLSSKAFIRYVLADRTLQHRPVGMSQAEFDLAISGNVPVTMFFRHDDGDLLRGFNRNVITQSYKHVFCACDKNIVF